MCVVVQAGGCEHAVEFVPYFRRRHVPPPFPAFPGTDSVCFCTACQPLVRRCLTTYECVKPLILYESTHWLRYRVEWKASSFSASAWNSGVGYVDSFEYDASLGLGLLYLDRSPFSRQSITGKGTLAFAKLATYDANRTNRYLPPWGGRVPPPLGRSGFQLGGDVNRGPQNWGGGAWEKGSIDRTINQLL